MNSEGRTALLIESDATCFDGHFPGDPMVPGAKLLDLVLQVLQAGVAGLNGPLELPSVKFLRPVRPGEQPVLTWVSQQGMIRFEVNVDGRPVASGTVRPAKRADSEQ